MDEDTGTGIPPLVETAWGLRDRPRKGPKPGLSLDQIVAAGLQVADRDGLDALSMSRVAAELGASTMSLYRYVSAKEELVALMVDAAFSDAAAAPPGGPPEGWRAGLSHWAWALRAGYQRHRWVSRVPVSGLPILPHEVAWFEQALGTMRGTGLAEAEKASVIMLLAGYVRNLASTEADIEAAVRASGSTPGDWISSFGRTLTKLADPVRFPALTEFIAAGVFDKFDDPDDEFIFGLERILDGIETLVRTRSGPPRG
jgi:AcrR family transcriptional regulator